MDGEAIEAGQDLRGALEAAFKQAKEPEEQSGSVDKSAPDVQAADAANASARARDEQGRFAKQEVKDTPSTGAADVSKTSEVADPAKAAAEKPGGQPARAPAPPNGWSAEAKAKWHELSPEVMAAIAAREQELGKAAGKMDEERAAGRDFQKIFQPYLPILQAEGTTPQQAVASLLNTAYILRQGTPEQKRAALLQTARQFNIDISGVDTKAAAGNANPELAAIQNELAQLKGSISQREQQSQGAVEAQMRQEIDAFASDPANVHFLEVRADMAALLSTGRAKDLKSAYDMACWARPDVRSSLQAQERAEAERQRKESEKARVEEARRKSLSVTGAPGITAGAASGDRSLRQELEANMAAARGAV